jgi:hypothetical protein
LCETPSHESQTAIKGRTTFAGIPRAFGPRRRSIEVQAKTPGIETQPRKSIGEAMAQKDQTPLTKYEVSTGADKFTIEAADFTIDESYVEFNDEDGKTICAVFMQPGGYVRKA